MSNFTNYKIYKLLLEIFYYNLLEFTKNIILFKRFIKIILIIAIIFRALRTLY